MDFIEKNKNFYFKKGAEKTDSSFPLKLFIIDAVLSQNKIYLLLDNKNAPWEIWKYDYNKSEVEKKFKFSYPHAENPSHSVVKSLAINDKEESDIFLYVSFYIKYNEIGKVFIAKYKEDSNQRKHI